MYRPVSVTIFGVLNLILGVLGVCGMVFTIALEISGLAVEQPDLLRDALGGGTLYNVLAWVTNGLAFVASLACGASGLGLLALKAWGRRLAIGYAMYALFSVAGYLALAAWAVVRGPRPGMNELVTAVAILVISIGISVLHAGLLWYFMTRPHVIAAFERRGSPFLLGPGGASPFRTQEDVPHGPSGDNPFAAPPSID